MIIVSRVVGRWASTGSLRQEPNRLGYKKVEGYYGFLRLSGRRQAPSAKRKWSLALHVDGACVLQKSCRKAERGRCHSVSVSKLFHPSASGLCVCVVTQHSYWWEMTAPWLFPRRARRKRDMIRAEKSQFVFVAAVELRLV